jgi:hypothetical protein
MMIPQKLRLLSFFCAALVMTVLFIAARAQNSQPQDADFFFYDRADHPVKSTMLESSEFYDADILVDGEVTWMAWLQFVPGEGDHLWVGRRRGDAWLEQVCLSGRPGRFARPTLTMNAAGAPWLSYEALNAGDGQWDVFIRLLTNVGEGTEPVRVSFGTGNDINHSTAKNPSGGIWVVWQSDRGGQFDILTSQIGGDNGTDAQNKVQVVSDSPWGDWHPTVAVTPTGDACVLWDTYDGESYNVLGRWLINGRWNQPMVIADGPEFQGRPQVVADSKGRTWALWEEGSVRWGERYTSIEGDWNDVSDTYGPLHRFRKLRLAVVHPRGAIQYLTDSLPMPSLALARQRPNRREEARELGAYYERGMLAIDSSDRLWVTYRHFYEPQCGTNEVTVHHVELGWRIFARCLDETGWSSLYAFDHHQHDGLQRLSIAPNEDGLTVAWTTGRTDRRTHQEPRGIAIATLEHTGSRGPSAGLFTAPEISGQLSVPASIPARPKPAAVGTSYQLVYGDLHRHTDLSLCFPYYDGSIDDAYRYAIDVARLDFLGITDHTRDIAQGNVLSQLWWRSTREVTRHHLPDAFFPYFAFERSHGDTDHNVISLRDDMLRNFPPPLPEFWSQITDQNTFTIPHIPMNGKLWDYQDDAKRPLAEYYQGYRNRDARDQIHSGLGKGYHFGFIASSDHLSTSASYAGVWAPEVNRESIFRAMQSRRTFGATDKIRLIFRSGAHWMGERINAAGNPTFQIEINGTAEIAWIDVYQDGAKVARLSVPDGAASVQTTYKPGPNSKINHYIYIHMQQTDGNQAWSSPIWIDAS